MNTVNNINAEKVIDALSERFKHLKGFDVFIERQIYITAGYTWTNVPNSLPQRRALKEVSNQISLFNTTDEMIGHYQKKIIDFLKEDKKLDEKNPINGVVKFAHNYQAIFDNVA